MKCENCNIDHDGSYGSGRFCSFKCARGFSTKNKRSEINKKVSISLKNKDHSKNNPKGYKKEILLKKIKEKELKKQKINEEIKKKKLYIEKETKETFLFDLSKRSVSRVLNVIKNIGCSICGWNDTICDLHHIKEKKDGGPDTFDNLTYVCPNCHRKIHSKLIKSDTLISVENHINEDWKNIFYVYNKKVYLRK